jgi:hypothetical protein
MKNKLGWHVFIVPYFEIPSSLSFATVSTCPDLSPTPFPPLVSWLFHLPLCYASLSTALHSKRYSFVLLNAISASNLSLFTHSIGLSPWHTKFPYSLNAFDRNYLTSMTVECLRNESPKTPISTDFDSHWNEVELLNTRENARRYFISILPYFVY